MFFFFLLSSNVITNKSKNTYVRSCLYDQIDHPYCPMFLLGDIVNKTGRSFQESAVKVRTLRVGLMCGGLKHFYSLDIMCLLC